MNSSMAWPGLSAVESAASWRLVITSVEVHSGRLAAILLILPRMTANSRSTALLLCCGAPVICMTLHCPLSLGSKGFWLSLLDRAHCITCVAHMLTVTLLQKCGPLSEMNTISRTFRKPNKRCTVCTICRKSMALNNAPFSVTRVMKHRMVSQMLVLLPPQMMAPSSASWRWLRARHWAPLTFGPCGVFRFS